MKNILLTIVIITNIILIAQMQIDRNEKKQEKLSEEICIQELIPIEDTELYK